MRHRYYLEYFFGEAIRLIDRNIYFEYNEIVAISIVNILLKVV